MRKRLIASEQSVIESVTMRFEDLDIVNGGVIGNFTVTLHTQDEDVKLKFNSPQNALNFLRSESSDDFEGYEDDDNLYEFPLRVNTPNFTDDGEIQEFSLMKKSMYKEFVSELEAIITLWESEYVI